VRRRRRRKGTARSRTAGEETLGAGMDGRTDPTPEKFWSERAPGARIAD